MIESFKDFLAGQSVEWLRQESKRLADQIERFAAAVGVTPDSVVEARAAVDAEIARRDPEGQLPW